MGELLRLRRDAALEDGPVLREGHVQMPLGTVGPGLQAVLELLAGEGADEDGLAAAAVAAEAEQALMRLQLLLRRLETAGWLERVLVEDDGTPVATLTPIGHEIVPVLHPLGRGPWQLSRFAHARADGGALVIETPKASLRVTAHAPRVGATFAALATPGPTDSFDADVLRLFVRAGLAVAPGEEDDRSLAQWAFADLLFHARSRIGRHLGDYGGSYRLEGRFDPLPALKPASENAIKLTSPDLVALGRTDQPFSLVLEARRSIRVHDDEAPLTAVQVGEFLYRVARIRGVYDDGREEVESRPYPSGGALHELELYPLVHHVDGLAQGLYRYDGHAHALEPVAEPGPRTTLLLEYARRTGVMETNPQLVIVVSARFGRMMWKYESMAYAAILKHVGVLYQTMYLVATSMGLAACALGGGNADAFAAAAGKSYYEESSVGEFLLGSKPDDA
ncbi:MAG TPA: SagB family peptide dehydrogenase [Gaiellaceae bacterium]|nr:SagB family peptide dehydrogenase [Gaiellaceae bacterium]